MIYADNAATTKLDIDAFDAMKPYLVDEYGNASQPYSFSRQPKKALQESRKTIAVCINASPEEIYFTSGGTESDNWAIKGFAIPNNRCSVITSEFEHHAILNSCRQLENWGFGVEYLHPSSGGIITPENLGKMISKRTNLVSIMMANNEIGTIQPIKELCAVAHQNDALFHTDAVQALGHIPVDVNDLGVDLLSCSAHKFGGPKGIGFLYIRKGIPIGPYENGGAQEYNMRAGTENVAAIVGMSVALQKSVQQMSRTQTLLQELEETVMSKLDSSQIDYIRNGHSPHLPGSLSLSFRGFDGEMLLHRLDLMGIMVSTGSACDSKNTQISHVLRAIELPSEYARGTIRISFGVNNTIDEAERVADALIKIIKSAYKS